MGSDSGKSVAGKPFSCNSHRQGSKVEVFDKTGFMAQTSKESALLHLVLPVFQLCRWTLYTSTSIHNNNEGAIVVKEGSLVRKVRESCMAIRGFIRRFKFTGAGGAVSNWDDD